MTDRATETYENWLERTKPAPTRRVSLGSFVAIAAGLFMIFAMDAILLGCIVLGTGVSEPLTVLRRATAERTKRRLSVLWTSVWALGTTVALVREDDRNWEWWGLLALMVVAVGIECRPLLARVLRRGSQIS